MHLNVMAEHLAEYFGKIRGGMSETIPGLYVGCLRDANDATQLTSNQVNKTSYQTSVLLRILTMLSKRIRGFIS